MDPIADMLTKIRNASRVGHSSVVISASKVKVALIDILKKEGFIKDYKKGKAKVGEELIVELKYNNGVSSIKDVQRVSTPGCRIYADKDHIPYVKSGTGRAIISTSKGLITDRQARKDKVGGEVICKIY